MAVHLVPPPDRLFRIGWPPMPFKWGPRQNPLPDSEEPLLEGRRWDDPDGSYATVYCGSSPEAAFAETIAPFRSVPGLRERILAATDEDDPDPLYDFEDPQGVVPVGYFERALGHAFVDEDARFIDVDAVRTHNELNARFGSLLAELGAATQYDRGLMMTQDRRLTRRVAGFLHEHHGDEALGIRYESRLMSDLECFALWPQARVAIYDIDVEPISPETPALVNVAERLELMLPALDEISRSG